MNRNTGPAFKDRNECRDFDPETARAFLDLLCPGVFEVRIPGSGQGTQSGYFDDVAAAVDSIAPLSGNVPGIYATLNPVCKDSLARSANRLKCYANQATTDREILSRRFLLIDFDPIRAAGVSSSESEHDFAIQSASEAAKWLEEKGFPPGVFADSGNGAHLLYLIDLPNDSDSTDLVRSLLRVLDFQFSDDRVKVDTTTSNASRISKVYGTRACKGNNQPDRPHRLSRLINVPAPLRQVPTELLRNVAKLIPPEAGRSAMEDSGEAGLEWRLAEAGLRVARKAPYCGGTKYVFEVCPFNSAHKDRSAFLIEFPNGGIAAGCHHESCSGNDWRKLKPLLGYQEEGSNPRGSAHGAVSAGSLADIVPKERLFLSAENVLFAQVEVQDHYENLAVSSRRFRDWLVQAARRLGRVPGKSAIDTAIELIKSETITCTERRKLGLRVADLGEIVIIDLGNDLWQMVKVTAKGWSLISGKDPHSMTRSAKTGSLPVPVSGGSVNLLRKFLNFRTETDFCLAVGFLLTALRGRSPFPILVLNGPEGSAKSTGARLLKCLVDPATGSPLRNLPREERDLPPAILASYVLAFDNVSRLPTSLSDSFCRLASGSGISGRALYTNGEEFSVSAARPIILNGIPHFVEMPDLLDRSWVIELDRISAASRRPEREIFDEFDMAGPLIFGALLDALVVGLANETESTTADLPRLADAVRFVTACETELGWPRGAFLAAAHESQRSEKAQTIAQRPLYHALACFTREVRNWSGTATELLGELARRFPDESGRKLWPERANHFSGELRRIQASLTEANVHLEMGKATDKQGRKLICLSLAPPEGIADRPDDQIDRMTSRDPDPHLEEPDENWPADDQTITDDHFPLIEEEREEFTEEEWWEKSREMIGSDRQDRRMPHYAGFCGLGSTDDRPLPDGQWSSDDKELVDWFLLLPAAVWPTQPFTLSPGQVISDPGRFRKRLESEVKFGPTGPRARNGVLQEDLQALRVYLNEKGGRSGET